LDFLKLSNCRIINWSFFLYSIISPGGIAMYQRLRFIGIILTICLVCLNLSGFTQTVPSTNVVGGSGGDPFSDVDIPMGAHVLEVHIYSGAYVDAVQMQYALSDGRIVMGPRHGGPGGQLSIFRVDSDESILGVSGQYGNYIDSIQILTTKRSSPIFGGSGGGKEYRINVPMENQAIGFAGRAGKYLDAVGLTYIPQTITRIAFTESAGGNGGSEFKDSEIPLRSRISEIRIHCGAFLDSIQAVYILQEGTLFEGPVHGGNGGRSYAFKLDPDEYVTGISGRYGNNIDSIVIITNKRTSQKFGGNGGGNNFKIDVPAGAQGVGFFGRSGNYLDAIGLAYAPLERSPRRGNRFRIRR
jgi:hypothetical protein